MADPLILSLDQGTTSTRAILFTASGHPLAEASRPLEQHYPHDGWVEHDAEEIFGASVAVLREVIGPLDPSRMVAILEELLASS